jgi:modulator of FtsH protease HflK
MEDRRYQIRGRGRGGGSWDDAEQFINQFGQHSGRWIALIVVVVLAFWLGSGIYTVGPGELGVVRQFGREIDHSGPGLRYHWPRPFQQVDIVDVATVRRAEIGFRTDTGPTQSVPSEALMLTGDENIVEVHLFVQYVVTDASKYLFAARTPEETLHAAGEVALRGVVGQHPIDFTMTEGRVLVQDQVSGHLQELLDAYDTGLSVREARLLVVDPPKEVINAFHEVVRALEDRERLVQVAEGYREDVVPRARGQAQRMFAEAQAYQQRRVLEARGDAARFVALFEEYEKAPHVTRDRMYLEMVERTMPKLRLTILDEQVAGRVLPLLSMPVLAEGDAR